MNGTQELKKTMRAWYALWGVLGLLAASNLTIRRGPAKGLLAISLLLAIIALVQARRWPGILGRRGAALAWCVLAMFTLGQLLHFSVAQTATPEKYMFDFSAYYIAGNVVQESPREPLYDLAMLGGGRMNLHKEDPPGSAWHEAAQRYRAPYATLYIYPPFFAMVMEPFARLPFAAALRAWQALSVLLVLAGTLLSFHAARVSVNGRLALLSAVAVFSFYPFLSGIYFGQTGGIILFLLAAGVWLLRREMTWGSALCFAVATLIKLTPVMIVPVLVIHRRWRWLAAYAVCTSAAMGLSVFVTGWAAWAQFWHVVLPAIGCGSAVWENVSIVAWVQEIFLGRIPHAPNPASVPAAACQLSKLVAGGIYAAFLLWYWARRRQQNVERGIVLVTLLGLAVSPITWWHHYTIALLPLAYLWCVLRRRPGRFLLACVALVAATNLIGVMGLVWPSSVFLFILALITPLLTIVLAFAGVENSPPLAQGL